MKKPFHSSRTRSDDKRGSFSRTRSRDDKPSFGKRPSRGGEDRPERGERSERPARSFGDRPERGERPAFGKRPFSRGPRRDSADRPERGERSERPARSFGDRPERGERSDRPAFGKRPFSRGPRNDSAVRPDRGERSERPARNFGDRPERGERSERPARSFGDRPFHKGPRRDFGDRPERGERSERPARSFGDRPERGERSERPSRSFGDRPSFGKRPFSKGPRRDFDKRPARDGKPERKERPDFKKKAEVSFPRQGVLLWGIHAVREALQNPNRVCHALWGTTNGLAAIEPALNKAIADGLTRPTAETMERSDLDARVPAGSVHQGVVMDVAALPDVELFTVLQSETPPDLIVVLDQLTDPHNVGAIWRSAAAFGAGAVITTERNAPTTTGVMTKTASGAAEHVPLIPVVNLARALTELQQAGYWCVGLAEEGTKDLGDLDLSGKTALILGAEGEGLRRLTREHADELARLPTGGPIGSLNVSNAAAVALYEVRRQKGKA